MSITIRPGTLDDAYATFEVFMQSVTDLGQRLGTIERTDGIDPQALAQSWEQWRPFFEHLTATAEHFWLAEDDGQAIGYARSILRDDVRQLTEFFVLPGRQTTGVGRELLAKAFRADSARLRCIVATPDTRAQARYLKAGVYPQFPNCYLSRTPEAVQGTTDLTFEPISETAETLAALDAIDTEILGLRRTIDHVWLIQQRQGYIYRRNGEVVGYGYHGESSGPFALLDASDYPAVLAHAEREAAAASRSNFGVELPMINRAAIDYLLGRGFQLDGFFPFTMTDVPFGKFENYILTNPPFIL
jgi:GNAT superfamily N-acetyltransferase